MKRFDTMYGLMRVGVYNDKITKAEMLCYFRAEVLRIAFRVFTDKRSPKFVSILYIAILISVECGGLYS